MTTVHGIISWAIIAAMLATAGTPNTDTPDASADERGDPVDYNGVRFTITNAAPDELATTWTVVEEVGLILEDTIYKRTLKVEERHNIAVEEVQCDVDSVRRNILAGEKSGDIIDIDAASAIDLARDGLLYRLDEADELDFADEWWDNNLIDDLRLDYAFAAVGDANVSVNDATEILAFNPQLAEDMRLGDLYSAVYDGSWTIDRLNMLSREVGRDYDGDGIMNENDVYGLLAPERDALVGLWVGMDRTSAEWGEDESLQPLPTADAGFYELVGRLENWLNDYGMSYDGAAFAADGTSDSDAVIDAVDSGLKNMFVSGNGLFWSAGLGELRGVRKDGIDFGILPYPKSDAAQEDYISRVKNCAVSVIPVTVENFKMSAEVLNLLNMVSREYLPEAYFADIVLTKKGEDIWNMYDLILANRRFDLGDLMWDDLLTRIGEAE